MSLWKRLFLLAAILLLAAVAGSGIGPASAQDPDGGYETMEARPIVEFAPGVDPESPESIAAADALLGAAEGAAERSAQAGAGNVDVGGITVSYDPANPMPPNAQAVVEQSVRDWASELETGNGLVEVFVSWVNTGSPNILASAGPTQFFRGLPGSPLPEDFFTPAPLANVLVNGDIQPTAPEIQVTVNADFNWYIGLTGNPTGTQFDLYTVMLHELGHGFGFVGSAFTNNPAIPPTLNDPPFGFDTHVYAGNTPLLDLTDPNSQLTSNNLFFDLPGERFKLYAPSTWQQGSSYSHWDEATYSG
ncbi:MAG: hypothetical protein AAFO29_20415, partial [Actinomycetota bacterium]